MQQRPVGSTGDLVLSGFGMVTSVGHNYDDACASMRAGLARPSSIEGYLLLDEETQEAVPLVGHPIKGITEGFYAAGLWVRMARLSLEDALSRGALAPLADATFWHRSALLAVTPDPNGERFGSDVEFGADFGTTHLLRVLVEALQLPLRADQLFSIASGDLGLYEAIMASMGPIASGRFDRCIVVCVDSLLDEETLDWLEGQARLKGPDRPSGLSPGEAGAVLVIEARSSAMARGVAEQVAVTGIAFEAAAPDVADSADGRGRRLASAMRTAMTQAGVDRPFGGDIVSDLNGEEWKAIELSLARLHLGDAIADEVQWTLPCVSVGDAGCATAAVVTAYASWRLLRRLAAGAQTLVVGIGRHGEASAICLARGR